jgi:hypothetical protein
MEKLKKRALSNVVGLCLSILLAHYSSLRIFYNSSDQHAWDLITIVLTFFGIKYIALIIIDFYYKQ